MTAMWVTQPDVPSRAAVPGSFVQYWESATGPTSRVSVEGATDVFSVPVSWEANGGDFIRSNISRELLVHNATMQGLRPRTRYGYRVGSNATGWSSEFFFVSQPTLASLREPGAEPVRVGWVGDMGDTNGRSFPQLEAEALAGNLDALIHVGDIAYDLDTRADESQALLRLREDDLAPPSGNTGLDGGKGDQYMRDFQPVASSLPYMVCPGNHEFNFNRTMAHHFCQFHLISSFAACFASLNSCVLDVNVDVLLADSAFTHRFNGMPMPASHTIPPEAGTNVGGKPNNWWYSFNIGGAHFISLNSGVVIDPVAVTAASRYKWDYPVSVQRKQYAWLEADLRAAHANRSLAPWVFVFAHYPMYCSSDAADCHTQAEQMRNGIPAAHELAWEPLLQNYSVDMFVAAHMHNYERMLPVHNNGTSSAKWQENPSVITDADAPVHVSETEQLLVLLLRSALGALDLSSNCTRSGQVRSCAA